MDELKTCIGCGNELALSFFNKGNSRCRDCSRAKDKAYYLTIDGRISRLWTNLNRRVNRPSWKDACYANVKVLISKSHFRNWARHALENWTFFLPIEKATLDRIKDEGHYQLGNLQLLTQLDQNLKRQYCKNAHAEPGTAWCTGHKAFHLVAEFGKRRGAFNELQGYCKKWRSENELSRKERRSLSTSTPAQMASSASE